MWLDADKWLCFKLCCAGRMQLITFSPGSEAPTPLNACKHKYISVYQREAPLISFPMHVEW